MESDKERSKDWKLKKVNKCWFLDVGGKLKRLNVLKNAQDVHMEDNIIFADDLVFQLTKDGDDEFALIKVEDICVRDKPPECENTALSDTIIIRDKGKSSAKVDDNNKETEVRKEDVTQETTITHQNKTSNAELTLVEDPALANSDDDESWSDLEREANMELGSEEFVPKTGKFKGFFQRLKQIVKRKPAAKQTEEPLYEDVSNISREPVPANRTVGNRKVIEGAEEEDYDYTLFKPKKDGSASSDAVPGAKRVTALFDFKKFSDDEISLKKQDKLKLCRETESDNSEWCFAEHLTTGEKGYIPLAYITDNVNALEAQEWWFDISRQRAVALLKLTDSPPGTYLVRPSESSRKLILTMVSSTKVAHYRINSQHGRLYISLRRSFTDIFELIDFYKCAADGLKCKLEKPAPKQIPVVIPRKIEVERESVVILRSLRCGDYGEIFIGKFRNTFDVTVVTKFKLPVEKFLAEATILRSFSQSRHFVRLLAVITEPLPLMAVLAETVKYTLQDFLRIDEGKTLTFKSLTGIAAEIADGMAYLEEESIVHGHLKAENVLICGFNQVKILPSQLSEIMKVRYNDEHSNCKNNKWKWTAPEATDNKTMLNTKTDVWSYGVLLYELITFGKEPYAGLLEEDTLHRLQEGFRLSKPKDGPVHCPVAFYVTILKCWHRRPECRPTFHFLAEFFHDFEVAVEYEIGLDDANLQDLYMRGPLQQDSEKISTNTSAKDKDVKDVSGSEARIDSQQSDQESSIPTSESVENVETTEKKSQGGSSGKVEVTSGFSVKVLYDYEGDLENDSVIPLHLDDVITDVQALSDDWWLGTAPNGTRGHFPSNYVEIFENAYAEVTPKSK